MRLRLVTRVGLIVAAALVGVQLLAALGYYATRSPDRNYAPDQIVALVGLLETTADPALRERMLAAAGGPRWLRLFPPGTPLPEDATDAGRLAWVVQMKSTLEGAAPHALAIGAAQDGRIPVHVRLNDGSVLLVLVGEGATIRALGLPVGFLAGLLGLLVGALTLLAVLREMRPLSRLSRAVGHEDAVRNAAPFPETGAPEMRVLTRAINTMRARNAALLASRTFALAAISHDLRTYLTRLRLRMEMMPDHPQADRARADLDEMDHLLGAIVDFTGDEISADGICADPSAALRRAMQRHDLPAADAVPATLPPLAISDAALARILDNLLSNARRYATDVSLDAQTQGRTVTITVSDRGPGIDAARLHEVVEPFVRLEASRNRDLGGAGLGLAIVRRLAEQAGGSFALHNRDGGGLVCTVTLPVH